MLQHKSDRIENMSIVIHDPVACRTSFRRKILWSDETKIKLVGHSEPLKPNTV